MLQDIRKQEKDYAELQDRLNALHNSIFQGNEKMDKFKMEMHWNQSELEQWVLASKQKEEAEPEQTHALELLRFV